MNTFIRKEISALSNVVSGKVVRRIGCELFDLKPRGDIFFLITLYNFSNGAAASKWTVTTVTHQQVHGERRLRHVLDDRVQQVVLVVESGHLEQTPVHHTPDRLGTVLLRLASTRHVTSHQPHPGPFGAVQIKQYKIPFSSARPASGTHSDIGIKRYADFHTVNQYVTYDRSCSTTMPNINPEHSGLLGIDRLHVIFVFYGASLF